MAKQGRRPRPADIWPPERPPWGAAWRSHARVARESVGYVAWRLGHTLLAWSLIAIAIALPASLFLLDANLRRAAGDWQGAAGFSVYFSLSAPPAASTALAQRLGMSPEVAHVRLITPAEAIAELGGQGGMAGALEALDANPLPATIRATLAAGTSKARLEALAAEAAAVDGVDEVVAESAWLERLAAIRQLVQRLEWLVAAMFGLGVVLVSSSSVRLAVEARLAEVQVLALVGASQRAIRRPFLYLGAIYGGGGGLLAAMIVAGALVWLEPPLLRLFASYGGTLEVIGFDARFVGALVASGAALGVLGAVLAARARLRQLAVVA